MKLLLLCMLVAAAAAKSLEYDEFLNEMKRLLKEDGLSDEVTHEESNGHSVVRNMDTRGKKKKGKKGGKKTGGKNSGGSNDAPKPASGVTSRTKVDVFKKSGNSFVTIKDSALDAHNLLRSNHGVPDLVWDNGLATSAQAWADKIAADGKISHSPAGNYGENVGEKRISLGGTVYTPSFVVYKWWLECETYSYNFKKEPTNSNAGHFSQVVWASTKKLGCGESTRKVGDMDASFVVCQYSPPGNYKGQYVNNVKAPSGTTPKSALDLHKEGCADYCSECSNYGNMCSQYTFVKETCCDTCKNK